MFWYVMIFIFGTIIGSFLNVVIYRLHTGKSLNGSSHCLTCGKGLRWYELFPLLSYVVQRGKCRGCFALIPSRYFIVEILTGLGFVGVYSVLKEQTVLLALYLCFVSICMVIVVYDIRHTIIPDELTILACLVGVTLLGYEYFITKDFISLMFHVVAGLTASFFFWGLWYVSKGRWIGFGDAKLAFPLGMIVGLGGVFSMIVLSFWIGATVSLALLGLQRLLRGGKKSLHFLSTHLTIKSEVPFAPFLILGFFLVQFLHADIFNITYSVLFSH